MDSALTRTVPYIRNTTRSEITFMTPEQRRRNRITGLILAVIVFAIMGWVFYRGGIG